MNQYWTIWNSRRSLIDVLVPRPSICTRTYGRSLSKSKRNTVSKRAWGGWLWYEIHLHDGWLGGICSRLEGPWMCDVGGFQNTKWIFLPWWCWILPREGDASPLSWGSVPLAWKCPSRTEVCLLIHLVFVFDSNGAGLKKNIPLGQPTRRSSSISGMRCFEM
jgi:hypothetical protein